MVVMRVSQRMLAAPRLLAAAASCPQIRLCGAATAAVPALRAPVRRLSSTEGPTRIPKGVNFYPDYDPSMENATIFYQGPKLKEDQLNPGFENVKSDVAQTIKPFTDIPREPLSIGVLGLLPYMFFTAASGILSWNVGSNIETIGRTELRQQIAPGIFDGSIDTSMQLLSLAEKLQVGYGAVIISFIGAIHWGLEMAKYGGAQGLKRYGLGIAPLILAWPTVLLSYDMAITLQFGAFVVMYWADTFAAARGWTPSWWGPYRFALTLVVGTCLITTLIVRGLFRDASEENMTSYERLRSLHRKYISQEGKYHTERIEAEIAKQQRENEILAELEKQDEGLARDLHQADANLEKAGILQDDLRKQQPLDLQDLDKSY